MPEYISVGEAAKRLGVKTRDISVPLYDGRLDSDRCPLIAGRRLVPVDYLPGIEFEMRRLGRLPSMAK